MKICIELTHITPTDSEYSALIHLCSSQFDRITDMRKTVSTAYTILLI